MAFQENLAWQELTSQSIVCRLFQKHHSPAKEKLMEGKNENQQRPVY